jgi:hypothetical protein
MTYTIAWQKPKVVVYLSFGRIRRQPPRGEKRKGTAFATIDPMGHFRAGDEAGEIFYLNRP